VLLRVSCCVTVYLNSRGVRCEEEEEESSHKVNWMKNHWKERAEISNIKQNENLVKNHYNGIKSVFALIKKSQKNYKASVCIWREVYRHIRIYSQTKSFF
jgi:hypothetical protein